MKAVERLTASLLLTLTPLLAAPVTKPNDDWAAPGAPRPALPVGEILPPRVRQPQFPLKDRRTLLTDAELAQIRANVERYPAARKVADTILADAAYWVDWTDEALRDLIVTAEVPRSFEVCPEGCPVHGRRVFEETGKFYPWIVDPKKPFQVTCPIGGETYPSNDYGRFYRSRFQDRTGLDQTYADDGRGWLAPNGERYWFVAHWHHWVWTQHPTSPHPNIMSGLAALGRAYQLTGDRRYAHKAAVILHRAAEVYPNMDYESQSRYGQLMAAKDGSRYSGKIINAIWETYFVAQFAETYDAIWETIDGDAALQQFTAKDGRAIRACIEANLIEDGIDAIYERRARGNYGMHQRALLLAAIVRQHGDNARYLADLLDRPDGVIYLGLRRALYGLVWRDGQPYESPGYNLLWVQNLTAVTELLPRLGVDVTQLPRLRRLYDAPLAAIAIGRHTPAIGDTTSVYGGVVGEEPAVYQQAYRTYRDPRYAAFLAAFGGAGEGGFRDFPTLLHPPVEAATPPADGRRVAPQRSRLLSGFGLALLNDTADETAVSLYFGQHVSHHHFDRLHFDLFARGQPLTPDLGYPDAMNVYVPGVWTWSVNTVAHNTVVVDAAAQPGNAPGVVELFADAGWARGIEVSAAGTYPQCDEYRRGLLLVDAPGGGRYLVDCFNVSGGRQQDYSLHGPTGTARFADDAWTAPAPGTLAGEHVKLGELYDDPQMATDGPTKGYYEYRGSGFQHLFNVQRRTAGDAVVDYVHEKDPTAALRIRVLAAPGQELMAADARVSPVNHPELLKYLIARRTAGGDAANLRSTFVAVLEPHAPGDPVIARVERLTPTVGTALLVTHASGDTDVVIHDPSGQAKTVATPWGPVTTAARQAVLRFDAQGQPVRLYLAGGADLRWSDRTWSALPGVTATVVAVEPAASRFHLRLESPAGLAAPAAAQLAGRIATLGNAHGRTAHTLLAAAAAGADIVVTTQDDLLAGLMRVSAVDGARLETKTQLPFAPSYVGATVYDEAHRPVGRIRAAELDHLVLEAAPADGPALVGRDVWIGSVGPGDRLEVPAVLTWQR